MFYIVGFQWDRNNAGHIEKHHVNPDEVEEALVCSRLHIRKTRQRRYMAYGQTENGRYLFVVFETMAKGKIRVITAREMTKCEKNLYRQRR